jgi:heterodisulfide reductase subunit C
MLSLRRIVLERAGQDLRKCQICRVCDDVVTNDADIALSTIVQLVMFNDEEVLTSRTLWSASTFANLLHSCHQGLDLAAMVLALREEAARRGIIPLGGDDHHEDRIDW